jgi:hypothetical protein
LLAQYFWGSGGTSLAIIGGACSFHVLGFLPGNSDGDKLWLLD